MRIFSSLILFFFFSGLSFAQLTGFPELPLSADHRLKSSAELPVRLNNSESKYFPEIINQHGWSCNQASSIGYVLTYELNQLRDLDSKAWENHYAPLFPWNFLNRCSASIGVSYFDTWEIVKAAGCATYMEFPVYNDTRVWMSGYEKYYKTMKNRVVNNYSIHVGTPEGLLKLKNYLLDHADGSVNGGLANIQIASDRMDTKYTNSESADPGAPVIISFGQVVGHALTIVGYDDSIGIDLNNDGEIRNDLDRNNDGVIDMDDWEMGAVLIANTWGKGFGRDGFTYVLYSVLSRDGHEGGIWNESVHVIKAVKEFEPVLTMKVVMDHSSRNRFSLMAGYSSDPEATVPEQIMGFPLFKFQGDDGPLYSEDPTDSTRFELGLDISALTSYVEPGKPARIFLLVDEKDPTDLGQGTIRSFSVINYGEEPVEYVCEQSYVPIKNDTVTYLSVLVNSVEYNPVSIDNIQAETVPIGETLNRQLVAEGGTEPYLWELVRDFEEEHFERPFPEVKGEVLFAKSASNQTAWVDLPFKFPYYGDEFVAVVVDKFGALHFNTESLDYPYAVDTDLRFKVRRSLVPFGRQLSYVAPEDQVCYLANDTVAMIIYDASVNYLSKDYDIQFATYLYPDGRIEFHYGKFDQPVGSMYQWITGISNGDGQNYKFASINDLGVLFENYGVCFRPLDYPADVSLSDDGMLTCRPNQPNRIWNIYVQVSDKNNQKKTGAVPISTVDWKETEVLSTAYPNPFSGVTTISFRVPSEQQVRLVIYDTSGRMIKTLLDQSLLTGEYQYYWNGTNSQNQDVVPGVYFYRLEIVEGFESKKIMKLE